MEADFGRTYVLGEDSWKKKLCRDIEEAFAEGKKYFREHDEITGSELFACVEQLAVNAGWEMAARSRVI